MTFDRRVKWAAALVLFVAAGAWLVTKTAFVPAWDQELSSWVAAHRPGWLVSLARVVTDLGSFAFLLPLTIGAGLVLGVAGGWRVAWRPVATLMLAATIGAWVKGEIARPRPAEDLWAAFAPGFGYPSGHSGQSAAAWLALAFAVAARWPKHRGRILATAIVVVAAVGLSRVILGVHSATDVLAGWALGTACALVLAPRGRS